MAKDERSAVVVNTDTIHPPAEYYLRTHRFAWRGQSPDRIHRICRLCFGYLPVAADEPTASDESPSEAAVPPPAPGETDDATVHFDQYRDRMLSALRSSTSVEGGLYHDATAERTAHESPLHLSLKRFVVRWLTEREAIDRAPSRIAARVRTNAPTAGHTADIRVDDAVFEIETGSVVDRQTDTVRNQFQQAFTKYATADVDAVTVVVDPLTMARHLDDVVGLRNNHTEWCRHTGITVQFAVPDLSAGDLVPLAQFARDITRIDD